MLKVCCDSLQAELSSAHSDAEKLIVYRQRLCLLRLAALILPLKVKEV
jgi:hypothetical protein